MKLPFLILPQILTFLTLTCHHSNGLEAGVKALGMGAVGVAYAQDAQAGMFNPAGMAVVGTGIDFGIGFHHQVGTIKTKDSLSGLMDGKFNATRIKFWPYEDIGVNYMITPNIAIGLVQKPLGFAKTSCTKAVPLRGTTKLGEELVQFAFSPMAAFKIGSKHAVGVAVNFVFARVKYEGYEIIKEVSVDPEHVTNNGYNHSKGVGCSFGWRWQITPKIAFGLVWNSPVRMSRYRKYTGLKPKGQLNVPTSIATGLAYHPLANMTVALDFTYVFISHLKAAGNKPFPFSEENLVGSPKGPGSGMRNFMLLNFGADYTFLTQPFTVRMGGFLTRSPIQNQYTSASLDAMTLVSKWHLACGATWHWTRSRDLSFSLLHGFKNTIRGKVPDHPDYCILGRTDLTHQFTVFAIGIGQRF